MKKITINNAYMAYKEFNMINTQMTEFQKIVAEIGEITTPNAEKSMIVISNIRTRIRQYVEDNKLQSLVLGVSGGLDSSVVAALCQEKYTGVPLIGISIPMSSSTAHKEQAQWIGDNYCSAFEEFQGWDDSWELDGAMTEGEAASTNMMSEVFATTSMTDEIAKKAGFKPTEFPTNVLQGNIKARLRMITLYDLARKTNGIVLSTDNRSEFRCAFWTKFGDEGDISIIRQIDKGFELPEIAKALNIRTDIITQAPSDGLMVTEENTDEAQLGANYKEVDAILNIYLGTIDIPEVKIRAFKSRLFKLVDTDAEGSVKVAKVLSRYETFAYKRIGEIEFTRNEIQMD